MIERVGEWREQTLDAAGIERLRASEVRYRRLVEAMPDIVWTTDPAGLVTMVNERWADYVGASPGLGTPMTVDDGIHPDDRTALAGQWQASLATGVDLEVSARIRRHDGAYRWHLLRAVAVRDEDGTIEGWAGTSTDIDAAKRAEEGLRMLAEATLRLDATLDLDETVRATAAIAVPALGDWCFIDLVEPDGTTRRAAVTTAEPGREDLIEKFRAFPTDPAGRSPVATALREGRASAVAELTPAMLDAIARDPAHRALLGEVAPTSAMALPLIARGQTLGAMLLVSTQPGRRYDDTDVGPAGDLARRAAVAISNAELYAAEQVAQERQRFLGDASALLSSSLDYGTTIERLAALAVPRMADWCSIELVGTDGALERPAVAHVDPSKVEFAHELRRRLPPDPGAATGVMAVMRTGKSELVTDLPREVFDAIQDPELRRIVEDLQLHSYMCVPLLAGGEVLGAITFVGAESGRRYGPDDLAFAEDLARRAASAVQNSRLFRDVSRYKRILDATLDAVFMFDPTTLRLSYVNQGAIDQLGYEAGALLAQTPTMLAVDLDDEQLRLLLRPLIEGRMESRTITLTLRHRSGRRLPVEVLLQHVVLPGEPGRVVAIARDIDDRVQAQARLQRLAEAEHARAAELNAVIRAMGEGVVVCGADGAISLANPAAQELFPDAASRTFDEILAQFEPGTVAPALGTRGGPVELRRLGEPERWIEMSTYPVASRGAGLRAEFDHGETIVLLRDVTVARQRQAVRDTFIGVLSHELRTPVTTIYAGSKVLARDGSSLDEEVRRSVFDDIHIEAERLHRLVEDVIALTRFGEEEAEVGDEPVLLQRLLPGVVRSEEVRWPGISFELRLASGLPTVVADPTYVEQVVRNLLSNAAKYSGPASHVAAVVEAGTEEVLVRILDDGPGFPPGEADRLFDLYYRSPSTAASASGAGIGLFVCARLIRAMGGRIWALPRPEGGAEFGFSLRVMAED